MKKVLIIEDDKDITKAMMVRLRSWGYEVDAVGDAVVATTKARTFEPDLILLDIGLPGGDGFTLAERFSDISNVATVPIVFITASKAPGLRAKARAMGAADYIEKPFNTERLLDVVTEYA